LIAVLVGNHTARAQAGEGLEELYTKFGKVQPAPARGVALEEPIDANKYIVGPSDRITIGLWAGPSENQDLLVTPEGTLLIPTVGEVSVAGLTLAEAKKKIISEVQKKYVYGNVTVTLKEPRTLEVLVTGIVLRQGAYTVSATNRVDKAIALANAITDTNRESGERARQVLQSASQRSILLKRRDGTVHRVDLLRYYATREDRFNPYLLNGDVIVVPRNEVWKNFVSIYGAVNVPSQYEYVEGDSLTTILQIAYGFTPLADSSHVEISRLEPGGNWMRNWVVDGTAILQRRAKDIVLQRGDRIFVREKLELREDYVVYVQGEVRYPGVYPITKQATRLSAVIRSAGGFTEHAFLPGAELIRGAMAEREIKLERLLSSRGYITPADSAYYYTETDIRLRREAVSVDFERLFVRGDSTQDVTLRPGDLIQIPSRKGTIYVFGQVVNPGHIPFVKGKDYQYYIEKAGGYAERARKGDVKIIKGRTKQWLNVKETQVEEGDNVWVPMKPRRDFTYYMNLYSQLGSALSVIVGIAVLMVQATR